jgi:hypothetical protein
MSHLSIFDGAKSIKEHTSALPDSNLAKLREEHNGFYVRIRNVKGMEKTHFFVCRPGVNTMVDRHNGSQVDQYVEILSKIPNHVTVYKNRLIRFYFFPFFIY